MQKPDYPNLPIEKDRRKKITEKMIEEMKTLHRRGVSDRAIAYSLGVNHTTVRYHTNIAYRERKNKRSVERLKNRQYDEKRSKIQKDCYRYRQEVLGVETVRKFQRENKKATRSLYKDYRIVCKNELCPFRILQKKSYRYSSRLHKFCPKCKHGN